MREETQHRVMVLNQSHLRTRDLRRVVDAIETAAGPGALPGCLTVRTGVAPADGHVPHVSASFAGNWRYERDPFGYDAYLLHPRALDWTPGRPLPLADHEGLLEALGHLALAGGTGVRGHARPARAEVQRWLEQHGITPRRYPILLRARRAVGACGRYGAPWIHAPWIQAWGALKQRALRVAELEGDLQRMLAVLRTAGSAKAPGSGKGVEDTASQAARIVALADALRRVADARQALLDAHMANDDAEYDEDIDDTLPPEQPCDA